MPQESVNRIFQSLFVYTVGFFELLKDCTQYLDEHRYSCQMRIWKVYMVLLESACKTDYRMITSQSNPINKMTSCSGEGPPRAC